jgi:hypothetical protein
LFGWLNNNTYGRRQTRYTRLLHTSPG